MQLSIFGILHSNGDPFSLLSRRQDPLEPFARSQPGKHYPNCTAQPRFFQSFDSLFDWDLSRSTDLSTLFCSAVQPGSNLTIRSSRARFAASCKFLQVSLAQGRKTARLNSGVSAQVVAGLAQELIELRSPWSASVKISQTRLFQNFFSQERFSVRMLSRFQTTRLYADHVAGWRPQQLCALTIRSCRHRFAASSKSR